MPRIYYPSFDITTEWDVNPSGAHYLALNGPGYIEASNDGRIDDFDLDAITGLIEATRIEVRAYGEINDPLHTIDATVLLYDCPGIVGALEFDDEPSIASFGQDGSWTPENFATFQLRLLFGESGLGAPPPHGRVYWIEVRVYGTFEGGGDGDGGDGDGGATPTWDGYVSGEYIIGSRMIFVGGVSVGPILGGVRIAYTPILVERRPDRQWATTRIEKVGEGAQVTISMARGTLAKLRIAWGQPDAAYTVDGTIERLDVGGWDSIPEFELIIRGRGARSDRIREITCYKAVSFEASEHGYLLDRQTLYPVTFKLVADTSRPAGQQLLSMEDVDGVFSYI